nr:universal stress protein [Natronococcus jeotgali]
MRGQILVPVDRSDRSDRALEYAIDSFPDTELTVLHVISPSSYRYGNTGGYAYSDEIEARLRKRGQAVLEDARRTAAEYDREVRTELKLGSPARAITEYATARGIDHVVLGSHGRDGVSRILLGSVRKSGGFSSQSGRVAF